MDTIAERVAKGAALLDEKRPGWVARIDLSRLDIDDTCDCVLGQVYEGSPASPFNPFHEMAAQLGLGYRERITHGFNYGGDTVPEMDLDMEALQAEWQRVITERQAAS